MPCTDNDQFKTTPLAITPATQEYAKSHGAKFDKEVGWYFVGDIPHELEEFVIQLPRARSSNITVYCPRCGGQMKLTESRLGNIFWGCMLFPKCRGTRRVEDTENEGEAKRVEEFAKPKLVTNKVAQTTSKQIADVALKNLGNPVAVEKWFLTPKLALGGKKPIEVLKSPVGQKLLLEMLRKIND